MIRNDLVCKIITEGHGQVFNLNTKGNAIVRQVKRAVLDDVIAEKNYRQARGLKDKFKYAKGLISSFKNLKKQFKNKEFLNIVNRYLDMNQFNAIDSKTLLEFITKNRLINPNVKLNQYPYDVLDEAAFEMPLEAVKKWGSRTK